MSSRNISRAFTLIELLIVVAIIGILAAIAVPNFLEAQVRAKVSRAGSDMRTIATAIESYRTDWNRVIGARETVDMTGLSGGEARAIAYARLTSPVAYLTTIPTDPFFLQDPAAKNRETPEYQFQSSAPGISQGWGEPYEFGYTWALNSRGPSWMDGASFKDVLIPSSPFALYVYDPTNGTRSEGYIVRTNKGVYQGPGT